MGEVKVAIVLCMVVAATALVLAVVALGQGNDTSTPIVATPEAVLTCDRARWGVTRPGSEEGWKVSGDEVWELQKLGCVAWD